jgi:hypothetical protein
METIAAFIVSVGLGPFVQGSTWAWPICEIFHFLGMSLLFGTIGLLDLRILGIGKGIPIAQLEKLVPWGIVGFLVILTTGFIFVSGETPSPLAFMQSNLSFKVKMVFIMLAGLNAIAFYVFGVARQVDSLGPNADAGIGAKVIAGVSLVLWLGVICFGRLIMYDATLLMALGL